MNTVITIGRQYGSGGREIGKKLAEYFDIAYYDNELLSRAAKESGFCEEVRFSTIWSWILTPSAIMPLILWICLSAIRFSWHSLTP